MSPRAFAASGATGSSEVQAERQEPELSTQNRDHGAVGREPKEELSELFSLLQKELSKLWQALCQFQEKTPDAETPMDMSAFERIWRDIDELIDKISDFLVPDIQCIDQTAAAKIRRLLEQRDNMLSIASGVSTTTDAASAVTELARLIQRSCDIITIFDEFGPEGTPEKASSKIRRPGCNRVSPLSLDQRFRDAAMEDTPPTTPATRERPPLYQRSPQGADAPAKLNSHPADREKDILALSGDISPVRSAHSSSEASPQVRPRPRFRSSSPVEGKTPEERPDYSRPPWRRSRGRVQTREAQTPEEESLNSSSSCSSLRAEAPPFVPQSPQRNSTLHNLDDSLQGSNVAVTPDAVSYYQGPSPTNQEIMEINLLEYTPVATYDSRHCHTHPDQLPNSSHHFSPVPITTLVPVPPPNNQQTFPLGQRNNQSGVPVYNQWTPPPVLHPNRSTFAPAAAVVPGQTSHFQRPGMPPFPAGARMLEYSNPASEAPWSISASQHPGNPGGPLASEHPVNPRNPDRPMAIQQSENSGGLFSLQHSANLVGRPLFFQHSVNLGEFFASRHPVNPNGPVASQHSANPNAPVASQHPVNPNRPVASQHPANPNGAVASQDPANPNAPVVSQHPVNPGGPVASQDPANPDGHLASQNAPSKSWS